MLWVSWRWKCHHVGNQGKTHSVSIHRSYCPGTSALPLIYQVSTRDDFGNNENTVTTSEFLSIKVIDNNVKNLVYCKHPLITRNFLCNFIPVGSVTLLVVWGLWGIYCWYYIFCNSAEYSISSFVSSFSNIVFKFSRSGNPKQRKVYHNFICSFNLNLLQRAKAWHIIYKKMLSYLERTDW